LRLLTGNAPLGLIGETEFGDSESSMVRFFGTSP
jgi:hypothetical protein